MSKSILTEDQWLALFAEEAAGATRKALSAKHGVHTGTINRQASARGLLKRQTGAPDHRRKPPGGWPDDRVIPQSPVGMTGALWREALDLYLAGEPAADIAERYGVTEGALRSRAHADGCQKKDVPGAVYRLTGPKPITLETLPDTRIRLKHRDRAFVLDRNNPGAAVDALVAQAETLAGAGEREACASDLRMADLIRRVLIGGRPGAGPPPEAANDDAPSVPPIHLRIAQTPPGPLPDGSDWSTWLFLGGRGAGKTLAGASWLADQAELLGPGGRLALVGPTLHDVREVMIEGPSGLRSLPRWTRADRPAYEPSRRRLVFANGCIAQAFSAEDPDSLRGPQFSAAWADEFCAWPAVGARGAGETLALLRMGLRRPLRPSTASRSPSPLHGEETEAPPVSSPSRSDGEGDHAKHGGGAGSGAPRLVVTTTPRPTRALISLRDEPSCALTHAGTADNAEHLSPGFLDELRTLYGGTRREAQEIEGQIVDLAGALFTAEMMAGARGWGLGAGERGAAGSAPSPGTLPQTPAPSPQPLDRVIIALDPTTTTTGDACGIIVAGSRRRPDGVREAVVLADRSAHGLSPDQWARRAVQAAREFNAGAMVAEVNQGGDMVRAVLKTAGNTLRVREVRATKGKRVRAEPVAALYEQGRVRHAPADGVPLSALEEELMSFAGEMEGAGSLDRADALVWAVTHLLIDAPEGERGPRVRRL
ncbi:terminase large subunit domain-containing protein [Brevundimonas sp.]|uniref:terminase large subunit domain-containing protein n=1 Tax=Brevundimonas sp. TaxID=1871086 RepID=UPI003F6EAB83